VLKLRQRLWGCAVKISQVCLVVVAVCFAAVTVHADSIPDDGMVRVGRGSDPSPAMSCGNGKTHFNIQLNGNGGGITNCINTSGVNWIGLDIFAVIPVPPVGITIDQEVACISFFSSCKPTFIKFIGKSGKEEVKIELLGGAIITAGSVTDDCTSKSIPTSCFFINLNDSGSPNAKAAGGWFDLSGAKGGKLEVQAITPEPSTLLLLASGAGALCFRRRRTLLA